MLINRDNYENFFLLYVDGELCAADMKTVEEFAAANKDLQKELTMLKETVLPLDEIVFEDKGELYRPIPIDATLQEKLLFKIDNELPEAEVASLAGLIATDKNVGAEFDLLKRTKLDASEKIVFEDKQSLYRRERDNVVVGRFVRWAAAAVLLGFGLYFGAALLNDNKTAAGEEGTAVAGTKTVVKGTPAGANQAGSDSQNLADVNAVQSAQNDQQNNSSNVLPSTKDDVRKNGNNSSTAVVNVKKDNITTTNNTVVPKENVQPDNYVAQETPIQKSNLNNLPTPEKISTPAPVLTASLDPKKITTPIDNNIVPLETVYARTASFSEDKNENKILYMDEDNVKRSKLGGFFRKVKRFAERTAKIKGGGNVSIAGFELAAK